MGNKNTGLVNSLYMETSRHKNPEYTVYAIRSYKNRKWYIGITDSLSRRIRQHISKRPDLYGPRLTPHIIWKTKSLVAAALLEQQLIKKYNLLEPFGNNRRKGGLTGHLLKYALKNTDCHDSHLPQALRDRIAVSKMRVRKKRGPTSKNYENFWRRKTWIRFRKGLPTLPGTEHYLAMPEFLTALPWSKEKRLKHSRGSKRAWRKRIKDGYISPLLGSKGRKWDQHEKDKISVGRIKASVAQNKKIKANQLATFISRAKQRKRKGLKPIPGTEIFLKTEMWPASRKNFTRKQQKKWNKRRVDAINRWRRQYGIDQGWIKP